jgi:hypothetical protein
MWPASGISKKSMQEASNNALSSSSRETCSTMLPYTKTKEK